MIITIPELLETKFDTIDLIKMGYNIYNDKHTGLSIVKTTNNVSDSDHNINNVDLKGLIFETETGKLVAPGCKIPLNSATENPISHYTQAHDGVMFRFYHYNGQWLQSTAGRITPNTYWGPRGCKSFLELLSDASDQWDADSLNKDYCYYVILEHPEHVNLIKHESIKLTLISIINRDDVTPRSLDADQGFHHHEVLMTTPPDFSEDTSPRPLTPSDLGYMIHYENQHHVVYRVTTDLLQLAMDIQPNKPDPIQHWAQLKKPDDATTYLELFPWNKDLFLDLDQKLDNLQLQICHDYKNIKQYGWKQVAIPARNVKYMKDLLNELDVDLADADNVPHVINHIMMEDPERILFMINYYNAPDRKRQHNEQGQA